MPFSFSITKKLSNGLGRAGEIVTPHGRIRTPAFVAVGTKGTIKALMPGQVKNLGAQIALANTYHLYLQPGDELIARAGGLHEFMHWDGPLMTDSGGFQVLSLGAAMGQSVSKISQSRGVASKGRFANEANHYQENQEESQEEQEGEAEHAISIPKLAHIDEDGVTFTSYIDGSTHRFTPERSMEIQHNLGADIMFAFDECTSPRADYAYQKKAMERTHRWAGRSLARYRELSQDAVLARKNEAGVVYGIVQGGMHDDLRKESARVLGSMPFSGYGIGGSFTKETIGETLRVVNAILPEHAPRHFLGIGEPFDLFTGVEDGADTFDCVAPTRMARNGTLYTHEGRINIFNARYTDDFAPIDPACDCATCAQYTRAYVAHLFRAKEMLAATLASIHNLRFIIRLVDIMRESIIDGSFADFKKDFLARYYLPFD